MFAVVEKTLMLFIILVIGFILGKKVFKNSDAASVLSRLEVKIFLPAMTLMTFSRNFTVKSISEKSNLLLIGIAVTLIVVFAMKLLSRLFSKDKYERSIYTYALVISNFGFFGYSLADALYGNEMMFNMMIFSIPLQIYSYTDGYCSLMDDGNSALKNLFNPCVISIIAGALWGVSGLPMPEFLSYAFDGLGNCTAPVSMIIAGIAVSEFRMADMLKNYKVYIVVLLRLIVIPSAIILILRLFGCSDVVTLSALLCFAMPCALNTVIFPKACGHDCRTGAGFALVSNILAVGTIPLLIKLFA